MMYNGDWFMISSPRQDTAYDRKINKEERKKLDKARNRQILIDQQRKQFKGK